VALTATGPRRPRHGRCRHTGQDIRYAFRAFRRARLLRSPSVGTVALGLGLIAVVFTIFDALYLRVDAVQRPSELFAVTQRHDQAR
jgi:hypothetical protein